MPFDSVTSALESARATIPDTTLRSAPDLLAGLRRGLCRRCPACGKGQLFCGYLKVRPVCAVCGNDNEQYPSDDFAPYVTMFLVLHLMVPLLVLADRTWEMSVWFEGVVATPIFSMATLALLPFRPGLGIRREAQSDAGFRLIERAGSLVSRSIRTSDQEYQQWLPRICFAILGSRSDTATARCPRSGSVR